MRSIDDIACVKRNHSFSLLLRSGVVGVGLGKKEVKGKITEQACITIVVTKKVKESLLSLQDKIPSELDGFPTDVITIGRDETLVKVRVRKSKTPEDMRTRRWRPAPGGVSVGHYLLNGAGTLGGWFRDRKTGEAYLLSCWHVIANCGACKKGDPVLQPAVLDGGKCPDDIIAYLDRWIDVEMIVPTQSLNDAKKRLKELISTRATVPTNRVDAAIAKPISESVVTKEILGLGEISGVSDIDSIEQIGMEVVKSGRTTGVTYGKVNLIDVDIFISYPTGIALFVDQITTVGIKKESSSK